MAQALRVKQRLLVQPKPLAIREVYKTIVDMGGMKGGWVLIYVCRMYVCVLCIINDVYVYVYVYIDARGAVE